MCLSFLFFPFTFFSAFVLPLLTYDLHLSHFLSLILASSILSVWWLCKSLPPLSLSLLVVVDVALALHSHAPWFIPSLLQFCLALSLPPFLFPPTPFPYFFPHLYLLHRLLPISSLSASHFYSASLSLSPKPLQITVDWLQTVTQVRIWAVTGSPPGPQSRP